MKFNVSILLVLLLVLLVQTTSVVQAQGPQPQLPPGWWVTKFVPTEFYDRAYEASRGWEVVEASWGRYLGRQCQGYWLKKWQAAPTYQGVNANILVVPDYVLKDSQCHAWGYGWHYNVQIGKCAYVW